MNNLERLFESSKSPLDYSAQYFEYLSKVLTKVSHEPIQELINQILEVRKNSKTVYIIGNGGSAATATHFANDLMIGPRFQNKAIKAISLGDNQSIVTAVGNDMGYDHIFSKQLEALIDKGDLLIAISASGNSPNLLACIELAKERGATIAGLTGFDGGKLMESSDIKVHMETPKGEYGPVEDFHMIIVHLVGTYIKMWGSAQ